MRSYSEEQHLFPPIAPRRHFRLETGDGHRIYVEECGNPDGIPVVFLHGGPGAGISPTHRRMFDPELFRVVLFDQRGAGQSEPFASVENNTTWHLVADMEMIRTYLGIDRWIIFGGSWGSTLGLAYGITHPGRCLGFVLRGVFLGSAAEVDWFLHGMGKFYTEAWDRFVHFLPEPERDDLLASYGKRLMSSSPAISIPAAESWSSYENSCATLKAETRGGGGKMALSLARMEAHYFLNRCFLEEGQLLDGMAALADKPGLIVQGRMDVICPPRVATNLAKAWPRAELKMIEAAGHSAFELGILQALISGLAWMASEIID